MMPSRLSEIAPCKGIPIPECLWNPKSWALESGILLKESGIPQKSGIHNPNSTDKDRNPPLLSGIHSVESRIQDCPGFPYVGRQEVVGLKRPTIREKPPQSDSKSNNMRCM